MKKVKTTALKLYLFAAEPAFRPYEVRLARAAGAAALAYLGYKVS